MTTPSSSVELVIQNRYDRAMAATSRGQDYIAVETLESIGELAGKAILSGDTAVAGIVERYASDIGAMAAEKEMQSVVSEAARVIGRVASLAISTFNDGGGAYEALEHAARLVDVAMSGRMSEGARQTIAALGEIGAKAAEGGFNAAAASVADFICMHAEKASHDAYLAPAVAQAAEALSTIAVSAMKDGADVQPLGIAIPFLERLCETAISEDNQSLLQETVTSQVVLYSGAEHHNLNELAGSLKSRIVEAKAAAAKKNPDLVTHAVRMAGTRLKDSHYVGDVPSPDIFVARP